MADMEKFSERLVDLAERFADVTDAAQGRGNRQGKIKARWLVLPAAGAGLYALGASGTLVRQARNVVKQAKERAADLPDDLMNRVHQATRESTPTTGTQSSSGRSQRSSSRSKRSTARTRSQRRRRTQTTSAR
jgi:hypothetical protein